MAVGVSVPAGENVMGDLLGLPVLGLLDGVNVVGINVIGLADGLAVVGAIPGHVAAHQDPAISVGGFLFAQPVC